MAEQKATEAELKALITSMEELVGYCETLQAGASVYANALPAEWRGPAMAAFLSSFALWSTSAAAMVTSAEGLKTQADTAHEAYTKTIEGLDTMWSGLQTSIPGGN